MLCVSVTWRSQEERACSSSSMFILRHAGKINFNWNTAACPRRRTRLLLNTLQQSTVIITIGRGNLVYAVSCSECRPILVLW